MAKTNQESGHAINLSNTKLAIDVCTGFGDKYNPANEDITIEALSALWNSGVDGQKALIIAIAATKIPIGERELLFKGLGPLLTRVMAVVMSLKASDKIKQDLKSKADKLRGYRKRKKEEPTPPEGEAAAPETPDEELKKISQSQMSYVQRANGFLEFLETLKTVKEYKVNEADLQIDSLEGYYTKMQSANDGMGVIITAAKTGLIKRNRVLYAEGSGILDCMRACKSYVKGLYGADSAELKLLTNLHFRDLGKKVKEELNAVA